MTTFTIGDLVVRNTHAGLYSGCSRYEDAVVAHSNPLILVSREGDMLWSATVKPEEFEVIGRADESVIGVVLRRFHHDYPGGIES